MIRSTGCDKKKKKKACVTSLRLLQTEGWGWGAACATGPIIDRLLPATIAALSDVAATFKSGCCKILSAWSFIMTCLWLTFWFSNIFGTFILNLELSRKRGRSWARKGGKSLNEWVCKYVCVCTGYYRWESGNYVPCVTNHCKQFYIPDC